MKRIPVYLQIVEELQKQIYADFYLENSILPSRSELCEKYNISGMTAVKVHNELERLGLAYKVRGKGVFVHPAHELVSSSIVVPEKMKLSVSPNIVIHGQKRTGKESVKNSHMSEIVSGIQQRAFELGLDCRTEAFASDAESTANLKENDALLIPYHGNCEWVLPVLNRKRVRCVVINNYFPETHSVVFDNYHGMVVLLNYLENKKCSKLFLCTNHFCDLGMANLSERTYAFENECQRREIEYKSFADGNFQRLLENIRLEQPDAVVFICDKPAIQLRDLLDRQKLAKRPVICGFDAIEDDLGGIVSVKTDYREMGRKAVDIIQKNTLKDWLLPNVTRVRSELLINK
jgi:DNA-binding LacI/PurR family transcriptional regulator